MKLTNTNEGVAKKKRNLKGLGSKISIALAGVLAVCAITVSAFAGDTAIETKDQATNETTGISTESATMSWWKAGVSEYDLAETEVQKVTTASKKAKTTTAKKTTSTVATTAATTTKATVKTTTATSAKRKLLDSATIKSYMYVQDDVKFRTGPSTDDSVIKVIARNTKVGVTGNETNGFYPVKIGSQTGYIMSSYLGVKDVKVTTTAATGKTKSLGIFKITAYSANPTAYTASGTVVKAGRTIAAPSRFAFGTKLMFNGHVYTVEDRGSAIVNNVIDLYVDTYSEACAWGARYFEVFAING